MLGEFHFSHPGFDLQDVEFRIEDSEFLIACQGRHVECLKSRQILSRAQDFLAQVKNRFLSHGTEFARELDGDFIFAIYHKEKHQLTLINNRTQAHKLYYSVLDDQLIFSESFNALLKRLPGREVHQGSIRAFVSNGFTMADQTQIKGIKKFLPAFVLTATTSQVSLNSYWQQDFHFAKKRFNNLDLAITEYETLYQNGVRAFTESYETKELGTLLSGGHDTSFCLIESSQVFKRPLHAFTCTFPNWSFNEESYAKHIAEKFGATFHPVPFGPAHLDQVISLISHAQEPIVGSCLPLYILAQEAKNHVDTLFGGDGGDTLWGEYYPVAAYHSLTKSFSPQTRRWLHRGVRKLRDLTDWERLWELEHVSSLFTSEDPYEDFLRRLCTYRHFPDDFQRDLFADSFLQSELPRPALEISFNQENFRRALIEGKLYNGFFTYQSFSQYRTLESQGLNIFFPTLSKPVMDFICSLPWNWINGGTVLHRLSNNKTINRRFHKVALSRYLNRDEIYNRSFDMPWHSIFGPRPHVLEKLLSALKRRGWYQASTLERLFNEFRSQRVKDHELLELKHHGYRIYTLLVLEVWARLFIDGVSGFDERTLLEDFLSD